MPPSTVSAVAGHEREDLKPLAFAGLRTARRGRAEAEEEPCLSTTYLGAGMDLPGLRVSAVAYDRDKGSAEH